MAPPKPKFAEGEKVLCFHGPLIYEAKCLKSSVTKGKNVRYFIHYAGWNKNWDEWVLESRVLKYNESNVQRQKEVQRTHSSQPTKTKNTPRKGRKSETTASMTRAREESRPSTPTGKDVETPAPAKVTKTASKDTPADSGSDEPKKKCGRLDLSMKSERQSLPRINVKIKNTPRKGRKSETTASMTPAREESCPSTPAGKDVETPAPAKVTKTASKDTPADSGSDEPKKKCGRFDLSIKSERQSLPRINVKIKIPKELQEWLVDDWDVITKQHKLMKLPPKSTVEQVVDNYLAFKKSSRGYNEAKHSVLVDVTDGVKQFFNATLGSLLLYAFERPQYNGILQDYPDLPMSQVYGAMHFLRLFTKLAPMLAYQSLDKKSLLLFVSHIHDFLKYMVTFRFMLFSLQDYENAPPEYHQDQKPTLKEESSLKEESC